MFEKSNNNVVTYEKPEDRDLNLMTLEELLEEAQTFGRICVYQSDKRLFHVGIKFDTITHTTLEAVSGFNHPTIIAAAILAIQKAREIRDAFKS